MAFGKTFDVVYSANGEALASIHKSREQAGAPSASARRVASSGPVSGAG